MLIVPFFSSVKKLLDNMVWRNSKPSKYFYLTLKKKKKKQAFLYVYTVKMEEVKRTIPKFLK